ncbi:MAG: choice-of-anchor A family protein [Deltaproteobacteria bacterium]|nr:choice-of-anchor A family protein [Deltaproteobacteria bacterium]
MRQFETIRSALAAVLFVCILLPAAHAGTPVQQVTAALSWLEQAQDSFDGHWGPDPVLDTALVLQAAQLYLGSGLDISTAQSYLSAQQPIATDYLARKIMALADDAHAVHQDVDELLDQQNRDGGFGFSDGYPSSVIDSILALDGLVLAGVDGDPIASALGYLTDRQHNNGAFSWHAVGPDSFDVTCRALIVMNRLRARYNLLSFAERAAGYISGHQNADGGFGEDGSSVIETALAILALQAEGGKAQSVSGARAFLLSVQDPRSGSWNGRVRDTALALAALHASAGIDLPNLQVHSSGIRLQPAYPAAGNQVTVTCEVRNTGSRAAENIEIELYLGDPTADGQFLDSGEVALLAAGGSANVQLGFMLGQEPGRADLYAVVDPRELIAEISTADNVAVKSLTSVTLPDLTITDIELSTSSPSAGEPFTVSATVKNLGEADAGPVTVGVYEGDPATSAPLLEVALGNVCGGCSGRADFDLTLPAGAYGYVVSVYAGPGIVEQNFANNDSACTFTVVPGVIQGLDLAVEQAGISFLPACPREDEPLCITAAILNRGDIAARDAVVDIYAVDALGGSTLVHTFSGVDVGEGVSAKLSFDGVRLEAGMYTMFVRVSASPVQQDMVPDNNIASNTVNVLGVQDVVDLAVDDFSISPAMPHAGDPVIVRFRISNHGNVGLAGVTFGVFDGDPHSGGSLVLDSLATIAWLGAGQSLYASGVFDTAGRGGEQTLYVFVDPEESFAEVDEENNSASASFMVEHDPGPDLAIIAHGLEFSPANPSIEDDVTMYATVCNHGSRPVVEPFDIALYAGQPQAGMQPIAFATFDSLEVNSCARVAFSAQAALLAASQSIFVHADYLNAVAETNEYNNTVTMVIPVSAPDLAISADDLSSDPACLLPGESFTLDAVLRNIGTHDARDVEAVVYSGPPESSPELCRVSLPLVAAGSSATAAFSISLPAGAHTLHVVVDPGGFVAESGTANNSASITVTVGLPDEDPVLDLAASRVRLNSNSLPDSAAITVRVSNAGTVDVDPGIDVAFYSGDPASGAILLGVEQAASGLAAGAYEDVAFTWNHPAEGEYRLFGVVDDDGTGQGRLTEINEINNIAVATVTITYSQNQKDRAVSQGAQWLVEHQHSLGGWEDVAPARANAAVLHALHVSGLHLDPEFIGMYAAIFQRVFETQASNGSWENSVPATADSVLALLAAGEDNSSPAIRNAVIWLKSKQQDAGGWNNAPPQTGHAVWALLEAGTGRDDPFIAKARQWLLDNCNADGFWASKTGEPSSRWALHYPVVGLYVASHGSDSAAQAAITKAVNWYKGNRKGTIDETHAYLNMLFFTGRNAGEITATMSALKNLQSSNGGWVEASLSSTPLEDPRITSEVVMSLYRHSPTGGGADMRKAHRWLKAMMTEPNGDMPYPYDQASPTSSAMLALNIVNDHDGYNAPIKEALMRCVSSQISNGNWNPELSKAAHHLLEAGAAVLRALGETDISATGTSSAISNVVSYLFDNQNSDGGWFSRGTPYTGPSYVNSTNLSLLGLLSKNVVLTGTQRTCVQKAITWLLQQKTGSANWETIGYTAEIVKILVRLGGYQSEINGAVAWLRQRQNADGGWGEYESTVPVTARVLLALIATNNQGPETAKAVQWLLAVQNEDGGWPILAGMSNSSTNPTALAVRALALAEYTPGPELTISFDKPSYKPGETVTVTVESKDDAYNVQQVSGTITEYQNATRSIAFAKIGRLFIGTHVLSRGHIAGTDIVSVEAQTLEGVAGYGVSTFAVENVSDLKCDLSVAATDIMFSPELPDEGRMVLIAAQVRNIGHAVSGDTVVRFFNGTQQIDSDQTLASLAPGASDIIFMQWDTRGFEGRNYIHVVVDPLNQVNDVNWVNNHAIRPIDVAPRSLPDLEVRDADISFADTTPVEGTLVSVSAAVRNNGAAVDGVVVHFYDGEISDDSLIASRIINEIVPHGGSRTVSALFDTAGRAGRCRIIVQADPHTMIREQNEANNKGSAELDVQSGGLGLELSLERESYVQAEDVLAGAAVTNSFDHERVVTLDLAVYDPSGALFAQVARATVIVVPPGGMVVIDDLVWNTASAPAGQWSVVVTLFEDGQRRAEDEAAFVILADRTIRADISTERRLYYDHAQVRISTVLQSFSPNYAFTGLSAFVELLSPGGDVLYADEHTVAVLPPLAGRSWEQAWNTALHAPGLYTLNLSIEQDEDGTPVASDSTQFTIARSAGGGRGLIGHVSAEPERVHPGQDVLFTWGISAVGKVIPDEAQVFISAVNRATQEVALVLEDSCYFDEGSCSGTLVLDSSALACGDYVLLLAAQTDGAMHNLAFAPVAVLNRCPVAAAGVDVLAHVGDSVQLNGSGSYDPDGHSLTYSWVIASAPPESFSGLVGADQYNPTLVIDRHGTYELRLSVSDGICQSPSNSVLVTTDNRPPVAVVGESLLIDAGETVQLDASASHDPDGDVIERYEWIMVVRPAGSVAELSGRFVPDPLFTTDLPGTYRLQLTVRDFEYASDPVELEVTTRNRRPVADSGPDRKLNAADAVQLDASASFDPDGDFLTWRWSILSAPDGSTAVLNDSTLINPVFTADKAGAYIVQLIVNDGEMDSIPDTCTITIRALSECADDLGIAQGYSIFALGALSAQHAVISGRIAAGGNAELHTVVMANQVPRGAPSEPVLLSGGDIVYSSGVVHRGSIIAAGSVDGVSCVVRRTMACGATVTGNAELPFDFAQESSRLRLFSARLGGLAPTGTASSCAAILTLRGDGSSPIQLFSISAQQLRRARSLHLRDIPRTATVIINISGEQAEVSHVGMAIPGWLRGQVLFNFFEARSLEFTAGAVKGSVLAPFAELTNSSGIISGTVIVDSWQGSMNVGHEPFIGTLPECEP